MSLKEGPKKGESESNQKPAGIPIPSQPIDIGLGRFDFDATVEDDAEPILNMRDFLQRKETTQSPGGTFYVGSLPGSKPKVKYGQ